MENIDEEICRRFLANPKINPVTGGRLIYGKIPYNTYVEKCGQPTNIQTSLKPIPLKSIPLKSIPLKSIPLKSISPKPILTLNERIEQGLIASPYQLSQKSTLKYPTETSTETPTEKPKVIFRKSAFDIKFPWGSNFIEWLLPNLKRVRIPYREIDTEADFYKIELGDDDFLLDWKHLDNNDINEINNYIKYYGYIIEYEKNPEGFRVQFISIYL